MMYFKFMFRMFMTRPLRIQTSSSSRFSPSRSLILFSQPNSLIMRRRPITAADIWSVNAFSHVALRMPSVTC